MTPAAPASPLLARVRQVAQPVSDIARATAFYRDVLGMSLLFQAPPGLAFFDCGGLRLMLSVPDKPEFDHPGSILYFEVADIAAAHATLAGRGVDFVAPPHCLAKMPAPEGKTREVWMAFFRDGERNTLALTQEKLV